MPAALAYSSAGVIVGALLLCSGAASAASYFSYDAAGNLARIQSVPLPEKAPVPSVQNILSRPGSSVWLTVLISDSSPLSLRWTFNGAPVPGASNAWLLLQNIASAQIGRYQAISTTAIGTVTNADLWLDFDTDQDGLGDSWEVAQFGSVTNQAGWFDADGDKVSNADEFQEGTNPKDVRSHNPRLEIFAENGTVLVEPLLPFYANGQTVTLTAIPDPGEKFLAWSTQIYDDRSPAYGKVLYATTNPVTITLIASLRAVVVIGLPVEEALDNPAAWSMRSPDPYSRFGADGWFGQAEVSHDGRSALQSGRQFRGSFLVVTNPMPRDGTVSFWWRSDTVERDRLSFQVNSRRYFTISGKTNWNRITAFAPAGTNLLKWEFRDLKSAFETPIVTAPAGAVWLDELVFEPYNDPLLDRDRDGLADLWEYRFFETLEYGTADDPDGDGVSNADEELDGTIPTDWGSVYPRLTILARFGAVRRDPDKPKYQRNDRVFLEAIPDSGNYFVSWLKPLAGTNTTNSIQLRESETVTAVFGLPLAQVLDVPALNFARGGSVGFFGQPDLARDVTGAAQSGPIESRQDSWMETTLTGPGSLLFWWRSSLVKDRAWAKLLLNGIEQSAALTGETDWTPEALELGAGPQTVRWWVTNETTSGTVSNAAWVDQVQWISGASAPRILDFPAASVLVQGWELALAVRAAGTPPLSFEWFQNQVSLGPASNSPQFTIPSIQVSNAGEYTVKIRNAQGEISSAPAIVTVLPVPPLNNDFAARTLLPAFPAARGHNVGATTEPNELSSGENSVWWRWIAPESGRYRAVVAATNPVPGSISVSVFEGAALGSLTQLDRDVAYGVWTNGTYPVSAEAGFNAIAGSEYAISVAGEPPGLLAISVVLQPGPANDKFAGRLLLADAAVVAQGTTANASAELGEPNQWFQTTASVWFSWIAPGAGSAEATVSAASYLPLVSIYRGDNLISLTRVADGMPTSGGLATFSTRAEFMAAAAETYQIQVGQIGDEGGPFTLTLALSGPRLTSVRLTGGGAGAARTLNFDISAKPGAVVQVEASVNLRDWTVIRTETVAANGIVAFTEAIILSDRARFYRVRIQL